MKDRVTKIALQGLIVACILLGTISILKVNPALSFEASLPSQGIDAQTEISSEGDLSATFVLSETQKIFLPFMKMPPASMLNSAWVDNPDGSGKNYFLPGQLVRFNASGSAYYTTTLELQWTLDGPCGVSTIFSDTVYLTPGPWSHSTISTAPGCTGYYIATAQTTNSGDIDWMDALLIVNPPSDVITMTFPRQGFDRCYLPSVQQMQTWWTQSPYWVFNIYLGGSMFFCQDDIPDGVWVHQVSQQGWAYILTWVGPQAPCSSFREKMSSNASTAYQQGRAEAEDAYDAARGMGFLGDMVIYYDMEGYGSSASSSCRNAVDSFMRGWAERLHQLGVKAGGYGSPASSHIADWANNNPAPDDVWIAHWVYYCNEYTEFCYNPNATVWSSYLDHSLWANHQRLRQYTGGHWETWGGVSLVIDSNALDGEVTNLPGLPGAQGASTDATVQLNRSPQIQNMELLAPQSGWMLRENRLLITENGRDGWHDITPNSTASLLAVDFLDAERGWVVRGATGGSNPEALEVLLTVDGGESWESNTLSTRGGASDMPAGTFYLEFIDPLNGFLALKLQSGSSFSMGRLFVTADGGRTWEERSLPLGEPVAFADAQRGWVAGGPGGGQLFMTADGGLTWEEQRLPIPSEIKEKQLFVGLPQFDQEKRGYLPVTVGAPENPFTLILASDDGGKNWELIQEIPLGQDTMPGKSLPFSVTPEGTWWTGTDAQLYKAAGTNLEARAISGAGLPVGVNRLDFATPQTGWALAQEGACTGKKTPYGVTAGENQPLQCEMTWRLWATEDGGVSWRAID